MRYLILIATFLAGSAIAVAQTTGGPSGGSSGASATSATGSAGTALSNGSTVNGTGGSPGPNTRNALNHGTTGNNLGAASATQGAPSHGNAVDTPAADNATSILGNTNTGVLKK